MRRMTCLLLTLFAATIALAQGMGGGGMAPLPPVPDVDKESLIFSVPSKWYPYSRSTENKDETFMFPTGQKPEKWTRGFRIEQFSSNLGVANAEQVYDMKVSASESACNEHQSTLLGNRLENGYSMALWSESCEVDADNSTFTLNKVIVGADRLYIVSKIWKNSPKDWDVARWERTLSEIFVCDPTTRNNPCNWLRNRAGRPGGRGRE